MFPGPKPLSLVAYVFAPVLKVLYRPHAMFSRRHVLHSTSSPSSLNVYTDVVKAKASIAVLAVVRPMTLSVVGRLALPEFGLSPRFAVPVYSFSEPPTHYLAISGLRAPGVAASAMPIQLLNASRTLSLSLPYRPPGSSASGAKCYVLRPRNKEGGHFSRDKFAPPTMSLGF